MTALVFYGVWLGVTGLLYNILWLYVVRQYVHGQGLMGISTTRKATMWSISFPLSYLAAAALATVSPAIAVSLYVMIPLYYLLAGVIDRHLAKLEPHPRHS